MVEHVVPWHVFNHESLNVTVHSSLRDSVHIQRTIKTTIEKECEYDVTSFHYGVTNNALMRFSKGWEKC